jgi:hypothetical protein
MSIISPNMGLIVPTPSTGVTGTGDPGPGYAVNISNDLSTLIDAHDHSTGKGVQITPAGMNFNASVNYGGFNSTNVKSTRYATQASALSTAGDVNAVYVVNGDLYYNNASAQTLQLTSGNSLLQGPAGPAGSPNIQDFFQGCPTGYTACAVIPPANGSSLGMLQINNTSYAGGAISQATTGGTGSAAIFISKAGLYEVNYRFSATGSNHAPNTIPYVFQTINATGLSAGIPVGTAIPQSFCAFSASGINSIGAVTASTSYLVQLGSGTNIQTYISSNDSNPSAFLILASNSSSQFGTIGGPLSPNNFTIKRIA